MDLQTPTRLLSIPLDVLLDITRNLTTLEYGKFRLTCKQIEAALLPAFSKEFFRKKRFMFTEFSLQALVDISKSRLSSSLSHVIFGVERPSASSLPASSNRTLLNFSSSIRMQNNCLIKEYLSHMGLMNTGQDVVLLAEAFSNLRSLETIGMRDFNSRSRNRDYPDNTWRSYGVFTYLLDTATLLTSSGYQSLDLEESRPEYISHIFLSLLRALGRASSRPKSFEVILRDTSLDDHAFNIPKYVEAVVEPVLGNLRTLFLDINSAFPPTDVVVNNVPTACPSYLLRRFLSRTPQLEHIRLNFRSVKGQLKTNDILTWLAKPVSVASSSISSREPLPETPPSIHLTKLQQLDIGMTSVEPKYLLTLIQKYRATLHTVSFHKISLLHLESADFKVNLWTKFFQELSKLDLKLSAINLSVLSQQQIGRRHYRQVTFEDSHKLRNPRTRNWAGPDIQSGLRDFIQYTIVERLDYDSNASVHGSDEDNSDDQFVDDSDNIQTEGDGEGDHDD